MQKNRNHLTSEGLLSWLYAFGLISFLARFRIVRLPTATVVYQCMTYDELVMEWQRLGLGMYGPVNACECLIACLS